MEVDILMEKMKQVQLKKYKFEYRGASSPKAVFGNSGQSKFHRAVQFQRFPNQVF